MPRFPERHLGAGNTACVLQLGTVVLGADDVERAVTFWANVFGYEAVSFPGSDDDFTILIPPDRTGTRIAVHRSITPVQERPRVHLDLVVDNSTEQSSEIERLLELWSDSRALGLSHRSRLRGVGRHRGQSVLHRRCKSRLTGAASLRGSATTTCARPEQRVSHSGRGDAVPLADLGE